jgi:hydrogenase maturation protease
VTPIAVIGIGNILLRDDGAGVRAIELLQKEDLPSGVKLVDGGTSVIDMLGFFTDYPIVFVIDALKAGLAPGTIYKIKPGEINDYKREHLSLHDVQILDVVNMAKMLGKTPDVTIFAIEPAEVSYGLDLTPAVEARIGELAGLVKSELARLG